MATFEGDLEEVIVEPELSDGDKKLVLVTHDESTFYANDGQEYMWFKENENVLRKKGQGQSIMVSEFQCPCHGTMRSKNWTSRKFFYSGQNREGWWKSEDMVEQLKKDAIPLFELLHPGCQAIFIFDQSSNHNAYANDALVASRMTLEKKEFQKGDYDFRDGLYALNGEMHSQKCFTYESQTVKTRSGK
jgi:hypothetical protein